MSKSTISEEHGKKLKKLAGLMNTRHRNPYPVSEPLPSMKFEIRPYGCSPLLDAVITRTYFMLCLMVSPMVIGLSL